MNKIPADDRTDSDDVDSDPLHIDLGIGRDPPFPFLICGFRISAEEVRLRLTDLLRTQQVRRPPGLTWFVHQFGGSRCMQTTLLGYAVRLPTDPHTQKILSDLFSAHADTLEEQLTDEALAALFAQLHTLFPQEGLAYGTEALLVGAPATTFSTLQDREIFAVCHRDEPSRRYIDCSFDRCDFFTCGTFSESHKDALLQLGQAIGMTPCVMLLWGNSD
jgi:hypothetical protein